jgi:hypothetical protein
MNRRAAVVTATAASLAGVAIAKSQSSPYAAQQVYRYEVADAAEAEGVLRNEIEGPVTPNLIQCFSLTPNTSGKFDLLIVSQTQN